MLNFIVLVTFLDVLLNLGSPVSILQRPLLLRVPEHGQHYFGLLSFRGSAFNPFLGICGSGRVRGPQPSAGSLPIPVLCSATLTMERGTAQNGTNVGIVGLDHRFLLLGFHLLQLLIHIIVKV